MTDNRNDESKACFKYCPKISSSVVGLQENKIIWKLKDCQNSLSRLAAVAKCEIGVGSCTILFFALQETIKSQEIENGKKAEVTWLSLIARMPFGLHQKLEVRVHALDENEEVTSTFPTMYPAFKYDSPEADPVAMLREEFIYVSEVTKDEFGMEIERQEAEQPSCLQFGIIVVPLQHNAET